MKLALQDALLDTAYGSVEYLDVVEAIMDAADAGLPLHDLEELLDSMERYHG